MTLTSTIKLDLQYEVWGVSGLTALNHTQVTMIFFHSELQYYTNAVLYSTVTLSAMSMYLNQSIISKHFCYGEGPLQIITGLNSHDALYHV